MEFEKFLGKKVVVDYRASNERIAFARGILISVEGTKVCIGGPTKFWMIDLSAIMVLRVSNGEKDESEPESYLRGD